MKKPYPWGSILSGIGLHYLAYMFMQTLCLLAETRRGPMLSDRMHEWIPAHREYSVFNATIWLPGVIAFILLLSILRPEKCVNYLRVGAAVSFCRGIFIYMTSLGPPQAMLIDTPPAMLSLTMNDITWPLLLRQWFPFDVFYGGSGLSAAYLTQDLFFSGHTATTVLFLFVLGTRDVWFWPALVFHLFTVGLLFLTHEHYTIDILGAYFITYALYVFFEKRRLLFPLNPADN
ncbi:MAG: hypothetical protein JNM27_01055 [Leptospirales bacterium]|nr:hypothetical protein [Leptospirales bacterium]